MTDTDVLNTTAAKDAESTRSVTIDSRTGDEESTTEIQNYSMNFGPQHPAAHGVLRLIMEMDGEIIERVDPHIGLLHRGTEKLIEYKTYLQALPYMDRLDYVSPMCMEHSYVLAIEKLLDLPVPERAQYIRVLFAELTRITNHILNTTAHAMDVGAMTPMLWLFEEREFICEFYERASGARFHAAYFRPGGVHQDLPPALLSDIADWADKFPKVLDDFESLVAHNRIFKQRNVDIGTISKDDAIAWGFSGPCLRGSGVAWDLRKSQPYDVYDRMQFDVPVGTRGDCYDRFMVRMQEMRESLQIVKQCIAEMPEGPVMSTDPKVGPPKRGTMKRSMEALINHFKLVTQGFTVPEGHVYSAVESPRGELGYAITSNGTNRPYRVHVREPSFVNLQAINTMSAGSTVSDVIVVVASLDPVMGGVDR